MGLQDQEGLGLAQAASLQVLPHPQQGLPAAAGSPSHRALSSHPGPATKGFPFVVEVGLQEPDPASREKSQPLSSCPSFP